MNLATEEKLLLGQLGVMVTVGEDGSLTVAFDITGDLERYMRITSLSPVGVDSVSASTILALSSRKLHSAESIVKIYDSNRPVVPKGCNEVDNLESALLRVPDGDAGTEGSAPDDPSLVGDENVSV